MSPVPGWATIATWPSAGSGVLLGCPLTCADKISHNTVGSQGHKCGISSQSWELTESIRMCTGSQKAHESKELSESGRSLCLLYPLDEDLLSHGMFDSAKYIMLF